MSVFACWREWLFAGVLFGVLYALAGCATPPPASICEPLTVRVEKARDAGEMHEAERLYAKYHCAGTR